MSFTTRCPACGTMFKVVPDQLKISDGWVRCGHCADAFDATLNLQATPGPEARPMEPRGRSVVESVAPAGGGGARPSVRLSVQKVARSGVDVSGGSAVSPARGGSLVPDAGTAPAPSRATATAKPPLAPTARAGDSGRAPLSDAGDSGWLLPPPLAPDGWLSERPASAGSARVDALVRGGTQAAVSVPRPTPHETTGDTGAGLPAWQHQPVGSSRAHKRQAATERETDFIPLDDAWSSALPDIDLTPGPVSGLDSAFHDELERFAALGAQTQSSADGVAAAGNASRVDVDLHLNGDATLDPPSFVVQARRQAFWRSTPVQALLVLLSVGLSALLLLQWVVHERDQLAARHPVLEPWLTRLCEPLGCLVVAPRQIDAVVIDSSQLVRRLGSFYAFDLVLKNTARMPVAMPALELTLTDNRDAVIARRVFLPADLPGAPVALAAMGSLPLELRLSLADNDASSMTGYRALVFYP